MTVASLTQFGQLPAVRLAAPDGACAIVTLYGGHLVSWCGADGQERLFCSAKSALDGSRAIRGGVPLIFPQFAARGKGMRHGFARVSTWRHGGQGLEDGLAWTAFALSPADLAPEIAAQWPHEFALRLRVGVRANELQLTLDVHNTGKELFSFSAALHSYFQVAQLNEASVKGLQGLRYADATTNADATYLQREPVLKLEDHIDRIYHGVADTLTLDAGLRKLQLEQMGFTDAVVWNPGAADAAGLADMAEGEYRRFVCVEAALIAPQPLPAGARWTGHHRVHA